MKEITSLAEYKKHIRGLAIPTTRSMLFYKNIFNDLDDSENYLSRYLRKISRSKKEALIRALIVGDKEYLTNFFKTFLKSHLSYLKNYLYALCEKNKDEINRVGDKGINKISKKLIEMVSINCIHDLKKYFKIRTKECVSLINAILAEDKQTVDNFFAELLERSYELADEFSTFPSTYRDAKHVFSNAMQSMLEVLFFNVKGNQLPPFDIDTILTAVMSGIPDTQIDLRTKQDLYQTITGKLGTTSFVRVGYVEAVTPIEDGKANGTISVNEYLKIMEFKTVDVSESIILMIGYLHGKFSNNAAFEIDFDPLLSDYMHLRYEQCVEKIRELLGYCACHIDPRILDIWDRKKVFAPELFENYSRRFFENRVSALFDARCLAALDMLESVNKFAKFVLDDFFEPIRNSRELMDTFSMLSELPNLEVRNLAKTYMLKSPLFQDRGRFKRPGFARKLDEAKSNFGESTYSRNLGVMLSLQPNYSDELSRYLLRNNNADVNQPFEDESNPVFNDDEYAVYIGAISGHSFHIAALLTLYVQHAIKDPNLQYDVQNIILAYAISFVSLGYHSYGEVLKPFGEDVIKKAFSNYGLSFSLNFPEDVVEDAMIDTVEYTKNYLLQKRMREELKTVFSIKNNKSALFTPQASLIKMEEDETPVFISSLKK